MKRIFDLAMAGFLFCFLSVPIFVVGLIVKLTSRGPALNKDWGSGLVSCRNSW